MMAKMMREMMGRLRIAKGSGPGLRTEGGFLLTEINFSKRWLLVEFKHRVLSSKTQNANGR